MSEESNMDLKTWKCDACAESECGYGLPCTLTSALLPEIGVCPVSGDECEWTEVESNHTEKELLEESYRKGYCDGSDDNHKSYEEHIRKPLEKKVKELSEVLREYKKLVQELLLQYMSDTDINELYLQACNKAKEKK